MARISVGKLDRNYANLRVSKVYPNEKSKKAANNLKAIGFKLTSDEAKRLGEALKIAVNNGWKEVDITGYRYQKRKSDSTYHITVTTNQID